MVEISLSGSGEGPGGAIPRGYSTGTFSRPAVKPELCNLTRLRSGRAERAWDT